MGALSASAIWGGATAYGGEHHGQIAACGRAGRGSACFACYGVWCSSKN